MANTAGVCNSFKTEVLNGIHAFGTSVVRAGTTADTFKGAVFLASGSLGPTTTTAYSATSEIANSGTYSAGGQNITGATPTIVNNVACWTPGAQLQWTGVTFASADTLLIYNSTQSNKAVALYNFGSQSVTAGTFTLTMPSNTDTTALLRLS